MLNLWVLGVTSIPYMKLTFGFHHRIAYVLFGRSASLRKEEAAAAAAEVWGPRMRAVLLVLANVLWILLLVRGLQGMLRGPGAN